MKKTIPFLLLIVFFAVAGWYSLVRNPEPVDELPPPTLKLEPVTEVPVAQVPVDESYIDGEPMPAPQPLPLLAESDAEIIQALGTTPGEDVLVEYLARDQLISRFVAVTDSLTSRQVPVQINPLKEPQGKFLVETVGENAILGIQNYGRYTGYVALVQGMGSQTMIDVYQRYYPLFQQAWEQNGGEGPFHFRLIEVIDHLLETPDIEGEISLLKPEAVYLFQDHDLEALSAGQKIMLRMGPDNRAVVKAMLVEARAQLPATVSPLGFDYLTVEEPETPPVE